MLDKVKQFFTFNNKERSGALILMCIIFAMILANLYLPHLKQIKQIDYSLFEKEIEKFEKTMDSIKSESQANVKYPQKEFVAEKFKAKMEKAVKTTPQHKIDINLADSAELIKLTGIGPVFASRIVKYRSLLGGYIHPEQLLEVYGMDSKRYDGILHDLIITQGSVKKININTSSFKEILKHPYISYEMVKEIVNYRRGNGGFSDVNELKNVPLVDSTVYKKILPYLII